MLLSAVEYSAGSHLTAPLINRSLCPFLCCFSEVFGVNSNQLHGDVPEVFDRLHHLRESHSYCKYFTIDNQ